MRSFSGSFSQIGSFAPGGLINVGRNDRSLLDSRSSCNWRIRLRTFGLVGGSGGFAGTTGLGFVAGFAAILVGEVLLAEDGLLVSEAAAGFLCFDSSARVAFSAGFTAAGFVPVAVFDLTDGDFEGLNFELPLLRAALAGAGLDVRGLATIDDLLSLLSDFPFLVALGDFDFDAGDFEADNFGALDFAAIAFLATGFEEAPLVAGFLAGLGFPLPFAELFAAGLTASCFFDALATAFTNRC